MNGIQMLLGALSLRWVQSCVAWNAHRRGGDTLFADMYAAYDGLPEVIKKKVEGRYARHNFANFRHRLEKKGPVKRN